MDGDDAVYDALMQTAPFHPFAPEWRFAAIGLLSNAIMLPAIGVLIAVATAMTNEDDVTQKGLRFIAWAAVAVILISTAMFLLDAAQTRALVRAELQSSFLVAAATAVLKMLFGALTFAMLARACRVQRAQKLRRGEVAGVRETKLPSDAVTTSAMQPGPSASRTV